MVTNVKQILRDLFYTSDLTINSIMTKLSHEYGVSQKTFYNLMSELFTSVERKERDSRIRRKSSLSNPKVMRGQPGAENPNWHGGRFLADGYWQICTPKWYTGSKELSISEHIVIYCELHDLTEVPKGYHVHHRDFDKLNNSPENLVLLTISEHMKIHNAQR